MKNIIIFGSTGSIGKSALEVIARFPEEFKVVGLTAGRNISLLASQIKQFRPVAVAVSDEKACSELKTYLSSHDLPNCPGLTCGTRGLISIAEMQNADMVISAIVGSAGLLPTIAAIRAGKTIALANKEALVMAGDIVMSCVKQHNATLLPVDSEHSAIFQCIRGHKMNSIKKIILTASGGSVMEKTVEELENITPEDALKHPNWNMGKKITIDSATLMNKGLEVIEAHYLFEMSPDRIDVLIHTQSIIHSIVEFNDGSYIAQLSKADMKGPIAYALSYPERLQDVMEPIEWERLSGLTFQRPDINTFPCLSLAYSALRAGGTLPAVLNASNEIAVAAFLDGSINFNKISAIIEKVMDSHYLQPAAEIEVILEADRWAREKATEELIRC